MNEIKRSLFSQILSLHSFRVLYMRDIIYIVIFSLYCVKFKQVCFHRFAHFFAPLPEPALDLDISTQSRKISYHGLYGKSFPFKVSQIHLTGSFEPVNYSFWLAVNNKLIASDSIQHESSSQCIMYTTYYTCVTIALYSKRINALVIWTNHDI